MFGPRTGIIFNNMMDDFATPGVASYYGSPPSEANFITPGENYSIVSLNLMLLVASLVVSK